MEIILDRGGRALFEALFDELESQRLRGLSEDYGIM